MTTNRIPGNSDRNPPLVVVSYARWRWLWCAVAIALPVVMIVVTLMEVWREVHCGE